MQKWFGASGLCINENAELLMVLQGTSDEEKTWSVPTGGREGNESFKECCRREVEEETGYTVEVGDEIQIKSGNYEECNFSYEVHYFHVTLAGGERKIQDPDQLIFDIDWKSVEEIKTLNLTYPEDRGFLIACLTEKISLSYSWKGNRLGNTGC
jgi:ADP-ribose pyrophosphatase YjhB (NUDIX family)